MIRVSIGSRFWIQPFRAALVLARDVARGFQERPEGLGGGGSGSWFRWLGHVAEFLQYLV